MNSKKIALIGAILLVIFGCIIAAGCTEVDFNGDIPPFETTTPTVVPTATPTTAPAAPTATIAEIAGNWYTTMPFMDGVTSALMKLEIKEDGTGIAAWYDNAKVLPYSYNIFHASPNTDGSFTLVFDTPRASEQWQVTLRDGKLTSTLGPSFARTPALEYWYGYEELTNYPKPTITKEHNSADYVADGDYYLEDETGRSFTATLWTGDITPYIETYKSLPKLAGAGSQAGEWVKFVRSLSRAQHAQEETKPVLYQTIDETMNRKFGTCDDLVILAARGLNELGIDVAILVFPNHMDIGIGKDDYVYLHNTVTGKATDFQSAEKMFDGYYYLDISDYQNRLDLGGVNGENGFGYDMTLKKIIPLNAKTA